MKKYYLILIALAITHNTQAQQPITWDLLSQVDVAYQQDTIHNTWQMLPTYSEALLQQDQADIQISGYVIPTDLTGGTYVLSAFPFSSCFFCGGAGPESVIELQLAHSESFSTDQFATFTGKIRLLRQPNGFLYVLENARRSP